MEDAAKLLATIELDEYTIKELQNGWETTEKRLGGPKEAGEYVFRKLKKQVPRTEPMFKRSSTVWHLLDELIKSLGQPDLVQKKLEYIALRHMNADITPEDVEIFKTLLLEITAAKLGGLMTPEFQFGLAQLVTAVGTSLANTHEHYAERLNLITSCWTQVNAEEEAEAEPEDAAKAGQQDPESPTSRTSEENASMEKGDKERRSKWNDSSDMNVPKTFADMARFNASVMGIGDRMWFADLLYSLESLVPHIGNIDRVQEECDVLALTLARYDKVNLGEFRSVLFASLRSLLPSSWTLDHENAWGWFWTWVEKKVEANRHFPVHYHKSLQTWLSRLDEDALQAFKLDVFETFFAQCEESQLYLRAANKRLQYIMGRILKTMSDVYTKTHEAVISCSALGLMHAGHGIPETLVRPFVQACMQCMKKCCPEEALHAGLWWTLDLVGRIFIRTLSEGSTPVIIAINKNTTKELEAAVSRAPRGERELLLLRVQVGTESISPLMWAVEKGAMESAAAILQDLLSMRADRSRYYYGMENLWERHPDIIQQLCMKAPSLLTTLLDGLIWRSKNIKGGMRRVNYYVSSMMIGTEGELTDSLLKLIKHGDPQVICHPSAVFQADLLWARLCCVPWVLTKLWFCVTLLVYIVAQQYGLLTTDVYGPERYTIIVCRAFVYVCSLGQLFVKHAVQSFRACRLKQTKPIFYGVKVPAYVLQSRQEMIELILLVLLLGMLCLEPVLHCLSASDQFLTHCCEYGEWYCTITHTYNRLATFPMLLYFLLAFELVNLHVQLSIFSVICATLFKEFVLYLAVLAFVTATFASAVACLPVMGSAGGVQMRDFFSWPAAFESLLSMALRTYGTDNYEEIAWAPEPMLKWFVRGFAAIWHVYLLNLMVAQLCQRYREIFHDARGNARLTRGIMIYETSMPLISKKRWDRFVESLRLQDACELDEGDNGPRGGVPTVENPYDYLEYPNVPLDRVMRFGGLASPELPWPELGEAVDDSAVGRLDRMTRSKFEEMERLMTDMAVKLGVRVVGGSSSFQGAGISSFHGSQIGNSVRENSKMMDDKDDKAEAEDEDLGAEDLNEPTVAEVTEEATEEAELIQEGASVTSSVQGSKKQGTTTR